jgi:hypothetical protein
MSLLYIFPRTSTSTGSQSQMPGNLGGAFPQAPLATGNRVRTSIQGPRVIPRVYFPPPGTRALSPDPGTCMVLPQLALLSTVVPIAE